LVTPITVTLGITAGLNPRSGLLNPSSLGQLLASDDIRYTVSKGEELALTFDHAVPAGVTVVAIRVFVEHFEQPRVLPGSIVWRLGHGSISAPAFDATLRAPHRDGQLQETLDVWAPSALPNPNALVLAIQNNDLNDNTVVDQVFVQVDYLLP